MHTAYIKKKVGELTSLPIIERPELVELLSDKVGDEVMTLLVYIRCDTTNVYFMNEVTEYLTNLSHVWLSTHIDKAIQSILTAGDDWNYCRLLELLTALNLNEKRKKCIVFGLSSDNQEIKETAQRCSNCLKE